MLKAYSNKDKRIKFFSQENTGPSAARNNGIKHVTGKYVYFLDSDDYLEKNAFEKIVTEMQKGYDMVSFNYIREYENGVILRYSQFVQGEYLFQNQEMLYQFICSKFLFYDFGWEGWNRVFRKDIIDKHNIRYDERSRIGEDMCFSLCYMLHSKSYKIIQDRLYHYVKRKDTLLEKSKTANNFSIFENMTQIVRQHIQISPLTSSVLLSIAVEFIEIEVNRLRSRNISDYQISKMAYKSLTKEMIALLQKFITEKKCKHWIGNDLYERLRYDAKLCVSNGALFKLFPFYIRLSIYNLIRKIYYQFVG